MKNNKFLLNALAVAGLGQIAAFSILTLSTSSALASNVNEPVKIQRFDLSKMSVGDLSNLKNESLKQILQDANNNLLARMYDSHTSSHTKTSPTRK
jgi:hypothetical protein